MNRSDHVRTIHAQHTLKGCTVVVPPLHYNDSPSGSLAYVLFPTEQVVLPTKAAGIIHKRRLFVIASSAPPLYSLLRSRLPNWRGIGDGFVCVEFCPVILRYRKYHKCRMWLKKESKIDKKRGKGDNLSKQTVKLYKGHFQSSTHFMFFYHHLLRFFSECIS